MRRLCCVLLVLGAILAATVPPASAAGSGYAPPVDEPIVDHFRPPATPYGPGNRGIDFATVPGEPVRAAAGGEVVFAGPVGLTRHVVVLHPDGIRTSYSFLASVEVRRGDHVARGDIVGYAAIELHFGARTPDGRYLDPEALLDGGAPAVHLIPVRGSGPEPEATERGNLLRSLAGALNGGVRAGVTGVAWARDGAAAIAAAGLDELQALIVAGLVDTYGLPVLTAVELVKGIELFREGQRDCTPSSTPPGREAGGRHLAVLVAGFGSSSSGGAVLDVETRALGYASGDVAQFSYRGGQSPGDRTITGIEQAPYGPADSEGDIGAAAGRLRALLRALAEQHPGVPIDLIAHSQGGLVVRAALAVPGGLPRVDHVISLGTPYHGADLADLNAALGHTLDGLALQAAIRAGTGGDVDPWSTAVGQLRTDSSFIRGLDGGPLPNGVRVTSIAASGDYIVPAPRAALEGATNVVVPLVGLHPHDALPGSDVAARAIALALAGQRPTCASIRDALLGAVVAAAEHGVATAAGAAGRLQIGIPRP